MRKKNYKYISYKRCRCEKANEKNERKRKILLQNTAASARALDSRNNNERAQEKHFLKRKKILFIYLSKTKSVETSLFTYRWYGISRSSLPKIRYVTNGVCLHVARVLIFFLPLELQAINISSLNWEIERQSFHLLVCVCVCRCMMPFSKLSSRSFCDAEGRSHTVIYVHIAQSFARRGRRNWVWTVKGIQTVSNKDITTDLCVYVCAFALRLWCPDEHVSILESVSVQMEPRPG